MSLPLYLATDGELALAEVQSVVVLTGAEARHAVTVRRTAVGERLQLCDGAGRVVTGAVVATQADRLTLRVDSVLDVALPSPRLVLVQALAKAGRDEQAIESATELGVDVVVPWQAARSIVQWRADRVGKALAKWDAVLVAATKQSRRVRRPELQDPVSTRGLVDLVQGAAAAFVLHEDATTPMAGAALPEGGDVLIIVGPEGGIAPEELVALRGAGGQLVRLGDTVLRSSSAGPAALAVLNAASRWR